MGVQLVIENGIISNTRIAFGGMAANRKCAIHVENYLHNKAWTIETILEAP
jgi:xanthine dehydrogenase iron-sulfur cluster and FAD-binding subunit A